jgi:hypothetical protein
MQDTHNVKSEKVMLWEVERFRGRNWTSGFHAEFYNWRKVLRKKFDESGRTAFGRKFVS